MTCTVKNAVYRNTPGEQYFTVSMVTHTVTTETVKYCSPGVFSYTAFFTVCMHTHFHTHHIHARMHVQHVHICTYTPRVQWTAKWRGRG